MMVGATILAIACKKPNAPSNSPVWALPTSFVMLASDVARPIAPSDAIAPDRVKSAPVGASAYPM